MKKFPASRFLWFDIDAFSIARIGQDQLYELADQKLQELGVFNVEITDMDLKPVRIIGDDVRYRFKINHYNNYN